MPTKTLLTGFFAFCLCGATLQSHAETSGSFEEVKAKAKAGDIGAQKRLAMMFAKGQGVATNYVEAAKWFQKAADKGDAESMASLGQCYGEGKGLRQNTAEAV